MKRLSPKEQNDERRAANKPAARRTSPKAAKIRREKAIEAQARRYWYLSCGHLTNIENRELYGVWRKDDNTDYCEKCGEWVDKEPPKAKVEYPERCPF